MPPPHAPPPRPPPQAIDIAFLHFSLHKTLAHARDPSTHGVSLFLLFVFEYTVQVGGASQSHGIGNWLQ